MPRSRAADRLARPVQGAAGGRVFGRWRAAAPLVAALAAVAVAVAACEGSASPGVASVGSTTNPSTAAQSASADALRYVQCMRSHGVSNLPGSAVSVIGGEVTFDWPAGTKREPEFASASRGCQADLPGRSVRKKHVNVQEELNFSSCMRSHGITDFPDPLPGGGFNIPGNTTSPQFEAAARACQSTGVHWNSAP